MIYNKNRTEFLALVFITALVPTFVFANAGSPMMWFGILHSLILNAIIGFVESQIITNFKISNRTWLIILGNYISMFIGLYYIAPHFSTISGNHDFWGGKTSYGNYDLQGFFIGMISSFLATLIIELPFFYFAVKNKFERSKIYFPFFIANTATNIAMFLIYFFIVRSGSK